MSRIGKQPISIPPEVEVKIEGEQAQIKGPKGELFLDICKEIEVAIEDNKILVKPQKQNKETTAKWGLMRTLLNNAVIGVTKGFEKQLEIQGIGYRAKLEGDKLILELGFSHPVEIKRPKGIELKVEKNIITVSGIDKQLVGQTAAEIRKLRPPEPYKGKGIRYVGEEVRRKPGKKAVETAGA